MDSLISVEGTEKIVFYTTYVLSKIMNGVVNVEKTEEIVSLIRKPSTLYVPSSTAHVVI